jgi:2-polyprenyl-3-methyl-5-hydroxy-6-metoxy-1,4-benzoquinol methylase
MSSQEYRYDSSEQTCADIYVEPRVIQWLKTDETIRRVLDAGCGNGNLAARIAAQGFEVTAFDTSVSGIVQARRAFSGVRFEIASGYDDLRSLLVEPFDACVAVEVMEHLYDPRQFATRIFEVLRPGGMFIVSTPYHSYIKNFVLAATGKMDSHFTALWDGGHIKFWSRATLTRLLSERGFDVVHFEGAGRLPLLWKSMILVARRPQL